MSKKCFLLGYLMGDTLYSLNPMPIQMPITLARTLMPTTKLPMMQDSLAKTNQELEYIKRISSCYILLRHHESLNPLEC